MAVCKTLTLTLQQKVIALLVKSEVKPIQYIGWPRTIGLSMNQFQPIHLHDDQNLVMELKAGSADRGSGGLVGDGQLVVISDGKQGRKWVRCSGGTTCSDWLTFKTLHGTRKR